MNFIRPGSIGNSHLQDKESGRFQRLFYFSRHPSIVRDCPGGLHDEAFKTKKRLFAVFLLLLTSDLFCSFRQVANALGAQCLFHRHAVFNNGDTLKIRMERPVCRALRKAFGVSKSRRFTACFTFCHFVQFLSYLSSALFQLQIYFSFSFSTNKKLFYHNFLIYSK